MKNVQKVFAQIVGVVLVLLGIIGFFNNPILGYFGVNTLQNVVHLAGGAIGLWLVSKGSSQAFNKWVGILGVLLGILGFVPGVKDLLWSLLGINTAITGLHLVLGVVALGVAYKVK
ncbi:MAG: DUF4383 domain-containing protein [Nanoarchaeota archaeon]|nr:DUF4383 domain-containing protein [Nanoarchaeota archaeon]